MTTMWPMRIIVWMSTVRSMWIVIGVSTMWPMKITDIIIVIGMITRFFGMWPGGVHLNTNNFAIFIHNGFNMLAKWIRKMIISWIINFYW